MCYHVKFGCSAIKVVHNNIKEPPKFGSTETPPPWGGAWLTPCKQANPNMCYHVKFGSFATKGVSVNRKDLKIGQRWDLAHGVVSLLTSENKPPLHMCCHVKFGISESKVVYINRREPPKMGSAGAPLPCGRGVLADPL